MLGRPTDETRVTPDLVFQPAKNWTLDVALGFDWRVGQRHYMTPSNRPLMVEDKWETTNQQFKALRKTRSGIKPDVGCDAHFPKKIRLWQQSSEVRLESFDSKPEASFEAQKGAENSGGFCVGKGPDIYTFWEHRGSHSIDFRPSNNLVLRSGPNHRFPGCLMEGSGLPLKA